MPLAAANLSHFVGGLGLGSGLALGKCSLGSGSFASGPSGVDSTGKENNDVIKT